MDESQLRRRVLPPHSILSGLISSERLKCAIEKMLHLCIRKFAIYDAEKETAATLEYLNKEIHVLTYDKSRRRVIVKNDSMGIVRGEYSFNYFDRMVRQKGMWTYYKSKE